MFGPKELIIIAILLLLLFGGRGKISAIMGDVAKGITSFKKGLKEDPDAEAETEKAVEEAINVTPPKAKTAEKVKR